MANRLENAVAIAPRQRVRRLAGAKVIETIRLQLNGAQFLRKVFMENDKSKMVGKSDTADEVLLLGNQSFIQYLLLERFEFFSVVKRGGHFISQKQLDD